MNEQTDSKFPSTSEPKNSNKSLIYIVAALAILLVASIAIYFIRGNILKERNAQLNAEIMVVYTRLDSIGNEMQVKIHEAIDKLPEERQKVFRMSRFEELKYKEIAEKLNISIKISKPVSYHISNIFDLPFAVQ